MAGALASPAIAGGKQLRWAAMPTTAHVPHSLARNVLIHGAKCGTRWPQRARESGLRTVAGVGVSTTEAAAPASDALFADYRASAAFLFPGQGAQVVGMGRAAETVPAALALYETAAEILGYDLLELCVKGPKERLDSTVGSQPAIYVTSLAAVEALRARDAGAVAGADVAAGLSLGEYTALAFAGAFTFEDGLRLVKARGEAMQAAAELCPSGMASVIGLDAGRVAALCDAANAEVGEEDRVRIANFLCPGNYAISGGAKGIAAVQAKSKEFKAKMTIRLPVAGAFHTHFMAPAVTRLEAALAATDVKTPRIPVISNVDGRPHSDPATIKRILAMQVTSPVLWENTVASLFERGLQKSYELGPGKVIAGTLKRVKRDAEVESLCL